MAKQITLPTLKDVKSFFSLNPFENEEAEKDYVPPQEYIDEVRASMKPLIDLNVGGVQLPFNRELQGFYISGSTGSGKTVLQKDICRKVRGQNQKMGIYDPKPEFLREFYQPGDVIFNPLDDRGVAWSPWAEFVFDYDRKAMAESFISIDPKIPGICLKAQSILAGLLEVTSSVSELQNALRKSAEEMEYLLKGSSAQGVVDNTPGTGIAISIMRNKMEVIKYLRDPEPDEEVFSFRKWIEDDQDRRWVYLTAREDQRSLLAPLITAAIDLIGRTVMSLVPNDELPKEQQRRIWLMLEELPSLPKIPVLEGLTAKGRGFGMCWVLTTQDPAQIDVIYTPEVARSIRQNCNTWIVFRANDFDTATAISNQIGVFEEDEKSKSYSLGVEEDRDGKSFSNRRVERQAVFASEVQRLPDLTAYLLFYGPFPCALVTIPFQPSKLVVEGIIGRNDLKVNRALVKDSDVPFPSPVSESSIDYSDLPDLRHDDEDEEYEESAIIETVEVHNELQDKPKLGSLFVKKK